MSNLLVYWKKGGKTSILLEADVSETWLTGEDVYSSLDKKGVLYPIINGRVEWEDRIAPLDKLSFSHARTFFFEEKDHED